MTDDIGGSVKRALEVAFPDRRAAEVERAAGSARPENEVVRVTFADTSHESDTKRAYLKIATDGPNGRRRIARDAALLGYVGDHAPVRTPRVLSADPDGDPPYVATAPLGGEQLAGRLRGDEAELETLSAVFDDVGRAMAKVHAPRFDRAGIVRGRDGEELDLETTPWPTLLREEVVGRYTVPERFRTLPERVADLLETQEAALSWVGSGDGTTVVVHDDLHAQNVFGDGSEGSFGVIDFETGLIGDPGFDLARTEDLAIDGRPSLTETERDDLRAALFDGYRTGAAALDVPVASDGLPPGYGQHRATYRVVTFLLTVATFDEWAADEGAVDDLARWVREEFDRRVTRAKAAADEDDDGDGERSRPGSGGADE